MTAIHFAHTLSTFLLSVLVAAGARASTVNQKLTNLPLQFEANRGQFDPQVRFFSRAGQYRVFLTSEEAVLALKSDEREAAVRMRLRDAATVEPAGVGELPGKVNYFIGSEARSWTPEIPTYRRVQYRNVYPGIDLVYHGDRMRFEFDFVVTPGADPNAISYSFSGASGARIDQDGDLILDTAAGTLRWKKPFAYQQGRKVRSSYILRRSGAQYNVSFRLGEYDRSRSLVIDPTLLNSTLVGGSNWDMAFGLAVDSAGSAYITGWTFSTNFPTANALQSLFQNQDAFVTKLNPDGTGIVYSTYLGGSPQDLGLGIAIDPAGSAYITGVTSGPGFPTTSGAFQSTTPDGSFQDVFVAKLSPSGSSLVYSTYLSGGPSSHDEVNDIAVDAAGNAYVTGFTLASNFPRVNAALPSRVALLSADAFVTKINPAGTALVYSTHLGGTSPDQGTAIAVDAAGRAYVTGSTNSADFPTVTALQPAYAGVPPNPFGASGPGDAFVTRFSPDGAALEYSTYLGGPDSEIAWDIAADGSGSAYVTGTTSWEGFPTTPGAFQRARADGGTAFVTKLSPTGTSLLYSTLLGGNNGQEVGQGIAVDSNGNAYVTGWTQSPEFPVLDPAQTSVPPGNGLTDAFVTKLNPSGTALVYSTLIGGSANENPGNGAFRFGVSHIVVDSAGRAYVAGWTDSLDFPTEPSAYQRANRGGYDAFVVKLSASAGAANPLAVGAIVPKRGGNSGAITTRILGSGFVAGTTFKLARAGHGEVPSLFSTPEPSGDVATARFDLRGQTAGLWDLIATKPDGTSATLRDAFTIESGGGPAIWSDVVGPTLTLRTWHTPFTVLVGNSGNTDALGVIVLFGGIPTDATVQRNFALLPPDSTSDWEAFTPYVVDHSGPNLQMLPIFLPVIRAGETVPLRLTIAVPTARFMQLRVTAVGPLFDYGSSGLLGLETKSALGFNPACEGPLNDIWGCITSLPIFGPAGCVIGILDYLRSLACLADSDDTPEQQAFSATWGLAKAILGCVDGGLGKAFDTIWNGLSPIEGCAPLANGLGVLIASAFDPNDKFGSAGSGPERFITGVQPLRYSIIFENKPTATAPAHEVRITDQLDSAKFDFDTLQFGPMTFGNTVVMAPPGTEFTKDVDLRPSRNLIVRIDGKLDKTTGLLTWTFKSIDPATGGPVTDPLGGFLPPNQNPPEGDGSVFFSIMPRENLATGTQITNLAEIIFDTNEPILTPQWLNTIDNAPPMSQVLAMASNQCRTFTVSWSGSDIGSGVRSYTVFVSKNSGPVEVWRRDTTATSAEFTGEYGNTYSFYSLARDFAGNVESASAGADVSVLIQDLQPPLITAPANVNTSTGVGATSCTQVVSDSVLGTATATDDCSEVTVVREGVPDGNLFPVGTTTVTYRATDANGNESIDTQTVTVTDDTPPSVQAPPNVTQVAGPGGSVVISDLGTPIATDNCLGVEVSASGVPEGNVFPIGTTTIIYTATDASGLTSTATQQVIVEQLQDPVPPAIVAVPSHNANTNGWNNTDVLLRLQAEDNAGGAGISEIRYSINDGPEQVISGNIADILLSDEGIYTIRYWAVDQAGNSSEVQTVFVRIDKTGPAIQIARPVAGEYGLLREILASYQCSDSLSGLAACTGTVANGAAIDTGSLGLKIFMVTSRDLADNVTMSRIEYQVVNDSYMLVLDKEALGKDTAPNYFTDRDVNVDIAAIGLRDPLRYFAANRGKNITLYGGQVGDEGWFALKNPPQSWIGAGPTSNGTVNYMQAGPGLGSPDALGNPESLLDKVLDVTPLRATGLKQLVGQRVYAVVLESDVSINYGPLSGSLKGKNLGVVSFEVFSVTRFSGGSSSSLPQVQVRILDAGMFSEGLSWRLITAPAPTSSSTPPDTNP